jgi:hypothetical protein
VTRRTVNRSISLVGLYRVYPTRKHEERECLRRLHGRWSSAIAYPAGWQGAISVAPFSQTRALVLENSEVGEGYVVWEYNNGAWTDLTTASGTLNGVYALDVAVGQAYGLSQFAIWSIDFLGNIFAWNLTN